MKIKMNEEILNVIIAVISYKRFGINNNMIVPKKNFDWEEETKKYYHSLPLPEGMRKNNLDFENILSYDMRFGQETLKEMCSVEIKDLCKYTWRNI